MSRLTKRDSDGQLFVTEEERLLNANGVITKDEMYKIMMHLAEKLGEYEDLEEQGLLLRLPCKVGDTAYFICQLDKTSELIVVAGEFKLDMADTLVFATRDEAEKALERMQRDL